MNVAVLKQLRKKNKLNQTELAKGIGVSASAIGMYEQGRREPDHETLLKLANFFQVSTDFLLGNPTALEQQDRAVLAELILHNLTSEKALKLNTEHFTKEDYEKMSAAIHAAVEAAVQTEQEK